MVRTTTGSSSRLGLSFEADLTGVRLQEGRYRDLIGVELKKSSFIGGVKATVLRSRVRTTRRMMDNTVADPEVLDLEMYVRTSLYQLCTMFML